MLPASSELLPLTSISPFLTAVPALTASITASTLTAVSATVASLLTLIILQGGSEACLIKDQGREDPAISTCNTQAPNDPTMNDLQVYSQRLSYSLCGTANIMGYITLPIITHHSTHLQHWSQQLLEHGWHGSGPGSSWAAELAAGCAVSLVLRCAQPDGWEVAGEGERKSSSCASCTYAVMFIAATKTTKSMSMLAGCCTVDVVPAHGAVRCPGCLGYPLIHPPA